jgi:nitrite reductase/ring-hydroxylating ferredoxin subunit
VSDSREPPVQVLRESRALREGSGVRFRLLDHGIERDAFAVRFGGRLFAYVNACRHENLPLDFGDARFFDDAYDALVCCQHGARYRVDTGECIEGPCAGGRLTRLALEERDGALWCLGRPGGPA